MATGRWHSLATNKLMLLGPIPEKVWVLVENHGPATVQQVRLNDTQTHDHGILPGQSRAYFAFQIELEFKVEADQDRAYATGAMTLLASG